MIDARELVEESHRQRSVARKTVSQEKRTPGERRERGTGSRDHPSRGFLYGGRRPTFPCMEDLEGGGSRACRVPRSLFYSV